jgi:hypothetical protein
MAFERIAIAVGKTKASAGITITQLGKAVIALRKDLVAQAGFKAKDTFSAMLGTDDDSGKLRIVKDRDGVACARELKKTGAFFFNLGMVPAIGVTPHKQRPIEARLVEGGIEIDIPPDEGPRLLMPPAKVAVRDDEDVAPVASSPALRAATGGGRAAGKVVNGIEIDLTFDDERVSFRGREAEVTTRQAKLVHLLARPRPQPVAETFLVGALWDGKPPKDALQQLRQICADLQKGLWPIGLDLRTVKGVGYQLKDL